MHLTPDLRRGAVDATVKRLGKLDKEVQKLGAQVDELDGGTPWRVAHEKRMRYYGVVEEVLGARDTLRCLGIVAK